MSKTLYFSIALHISLKLISQSIDKRPCPFDHQSGWDTSSIETAKESWKYAQISYNVYLEKDSFLLSEYYRKVEAFENKKLSFYAELFQDLRTKEYILAFRGTDSFKDYLTGNLPFCAMMKQQKYALKIFDSIRIKYDGKFVVIGHSLGGGLATHISVNRKNVIMYNFNPSGVFRKNGDHDNERYSIVEHGEILKLVRMPGSEPTQIYTSLGTIRGGPIKQHSMRKLAGNLTRIAAIEDLGARRSTIEHHLEKQDCPE